jgi:hypothetical protein
MKVAIVNTIDAVFITDAEFGEVFAKQRSSALGIEFEIKVIFWRHFEIE